MAKNVYIHVPFCKSKCKYCSFVSFNKLNSKDEYLNALKTQINAEYQGEELETLYFGGGTPSLLSDIELASILELFEFSKNAEITIEVNPDSVSLEYLKSIRSIGINRISIGSQTFDDKILKLIGRRHNSEQIYNAVLWARAVGFNNISLDLIYGLPTQSLSDFEKDLNTVIDLGVQHVSLYGLKIDEGCAFSKKTPAKLPNLDEQADMYLKAVEVLTGGGFEHYEVSNFAFYGFESNHNLNYWNNNTYYGFGCAASGYLNNERYTNQTDLNKYIVNPLKKISVQSLTESEVLEEAIFLGLRKVAGINIDEINKKFGINFEKKYSTILDKYAQFFTKTKNGYSLTLNGILISNEILSEFVEC